MPIYRVNGKTYDIPEEKTSRFENAYPDATVDVYDRATGKGYDMPVSRLAKFKERFPKWSYNNVSESNREESDSVVESPMRPTDNRDVEIRPDSLLNIGTEPDNGNAVEGNPLMRQFVRPDFFNVPDSLETDSPSAPYVPEPIDMTMPSDSMDKNVSEDKKWKPTPMQKAFKMDEMQSGVDATLERMQKNVESTRRLAESRTEEGRNRRKAAEMSARIFGTPTKVLGLTPNTSPATEGNSDTPKGQSNPNSPVVHGIKLEDGVAKTEWMLPDGSLSTSLIDADKAEYGARQARLQYEFIKRMEQNGLNPAKKGDVEKQKQKDLLDTAEKQTRIRLAENEENLHELYDKRAKRLDEQGEWNDDEGFWPNFVRIVGGAANRSVTANAPRPKQSMTAEDKAIGTYLTENQVLTDAKKLLETRKLDKSDGFMGGFWKIGNNWRNMKMGARHALSDADLYVGGVMALQKATQLMDVEEKLKQGADLTDAEVSLVYSTMLGQDVRDNIETPHGYNAAQITVEMSPFMAQMVLNPASGLSRALVTKYGKSGLRKIAMRKAAQGLTGEAAEAFAKKETRKLAAKTVGVQVLGDVAEASVLANTLQAPRTAANAIERYQGDIVEDNNGNLSFDGNHNWGEAIYKAETSAIIENYTEMLGEHFGIIGNAIGKGVGKGLRAVGGGKMVDAVSDMIGKIGSNEWAKAIGEVEKRAHWNGTVGEVLEEEAGIVLNSIFTGDNKISDLWDADQQIDIVLGVGLFGGFVSGLKTVGYPVAKAKAKGNLRKSNSIGSWRFGEDWGEIRSQIENADEKDLGIVIRDLVRTHAKSDEQGKAIVEYAHSLMKARGYEIASATTRTEGTSTPEQQDIEESFEHGEQLVESEDSQAMNDAKRMLDLQRGRLASALSEDSVQDFDNDPIGALSVTHDPELRGIATDYVNAKAVYDGMIQRVRDDVDGRIAQSNAMIDSRINRETGMIQPATMKADDRRVYIVNGTVAMFEDGAGVDTSNSSESIIIRDAETGKVEFADPAQFHSVDEAVDAETEKEVARNQIIEDVAVPAANSIEGKVSFAPGESYSVLDIDGNPEDIAILGQPTDENGIPLDGYVDIQYPDGTIQSVATSDLQQWVDAANTRRVEQFDNERQAQRAAADEAARHADQSGLTNPNRRTDLMPDDYKMPYDNRPVRATRYIESENGTGGTLYQDENGNDAVVIAAIDDNNYVGYFREYDEQGQPTNRWSAKFQNGSGMRENHRDMMLTAQELLPAGHELTEHTSVSTDGLRNLANQLKHGYELQYDEQGDIVTTEVAINMMARDNTLGLSDYEPGSIDPARVSSEEYKEAASRLIPYMEALGLSKFNIHWEDGTMYVDHPILKRADTPQQEVQPVVAENAETVPNSAENAGIPTENRDSDTETVPKTENYVENVQQTADDGFIPIDPDIKPDENGEINIPSPGTAEADATLAPKEPKPSALSQIPTNEKGEPIYEQVDADLAWDGLLEETEDENIAQNVIMQEIEEREDALKKISKQKPKAGLSTNEKIKAEKDKKKIMDGIQQSIDHWKRMAQTKQRRQAEEDAIRSAEMRKRAEEARIKAEQEREEREEAERIEREALNGVPDWSRDTPQDARARGYRRNGPQKVDRQEDVASVQGKEIEVKFGDNELPKGHAIIIDASALQPSHIQGSRNPAHFLDEAQPKERDDAASISSAQKIASNIRPEEITSSVTAYTGAPTVNLRGETIQGNSRSDALRLMYESKPEQAAKYRQYLIDHASDFGLTPEQIASVERPVLVNMLDVADEEAIRLGQFVAQDTESGGIERIKPKNTVQRMGNDMSGFTNILLHSENDEESVSQLIDSNGAETLKWMASRGHITDTQYQSAFDSRGYLTDEAKNDLKGMLFENVFAGGSTRLREMFHRMPSKAQRAILAVAHRDHNSKPEDSVREELQQSIVAYNEMMEYPDVARATNLEAAIRGMETWSLQYAYDDVSGESHLPSEKYSNFALRLAAMYRGGSQKFIQQTFNDLFDAIQGTAQDTLFEEADKTPKSLGEAIKRVLDIEYQPANRKENGKNGSDTVGVDTPQGETGRPGINGNADIGERHPDSAGPTDSGAGTSYDSGERGDIAPVGKGRFGSIFTAFRGKAKDAWQYLSKLKSGQAKGVFYRPEIGEIDLVWGEAPTPYSGKGLAHIDRKHVKTLGDFASMEEAIGIIDDVVKNGIFAEQDARTAVFDKGVYRVVVARDDAGNWVLTAFDNKTPAKEKKKRKDAATRGTAGQPNAEARAVAPDLSDGKDNTLPLDRQAEGNKKYSVLDNAEEQESAIQAEEDALDPRIEFKDDDWIEGGGYTPTLKRTVVIDGTHNVTQVDAPNDKGDYTGSIFEYDGKAFGDLKEVISYIDSSQPATIGERIAEAETEVNTNPTDGQKKAGNYRKGHVQVGTFDVTIENPKGSKRSGTDADGKKWETTMTHTYGYILGTKGVDGDHIDVYLSSDIDGWNGRKVFVVDQYNPDGSFDEHKVMLGFNDRDEAFEAYLSNYEAGWKKGRRLDVTAVNLDDFEKWIESSKRKTKAFADYKSIKSKEDNSIVGRSLSEQEASDLIARMEMSAEKAPAIELTPENWIAQFGENGTVETPVGIVKMGENQYFKMAQQGRNGKLGMIKPTLQTPNVIVEDFRPASSVESERDSSYIFVKTFTKDNGERYYHFTSVTVRKDGREVVISNQERTKNRISKLLQQGTITWINDDSLHPKAQVGKSVSLNDSNIPTNSDNGDALLGVNSSVNDEGLSLGSERSLTEAPGKSEGPDLVPTSDNNIVETSKPTEREGGRILTLQESNATGDASQGLSYGSKDNTLPSDKQAEVGESSKGYTITPTTYTNKQGKTSDVWNVRFNRELGKEEKAVLKAFVREPLEAGRKTPRGWYDHKDGSYMMRSEEGAKELARMLDGAESATDGVTSMEPLTHDLWAGMDGETRLSVSTRDMLTREEIENSNLDEVIKDNAIAFINGKRGFIPECSYLNAYENVRFTDRDSSENSGGENTTQLAGTDNVGGDRRKEGGRDGRISEPLDRGSIPANVSGEGIGRTRGEGGIDSHIGKEGSGIFSEASSGVDRDTSRGVGRERGRDDRGARSDGRAGGRTGGHPDFGNDGGRDAQAGSREAGTVASEEKDADTLLKEGLEEFKTLLEEFKRAGKNDLSISVIGMSARQLELLPRLIAAGAKVGYALLRKGITAFSGWRKNMRDHFVLPLRNAGLADSEIEEWIREMWDCHYTVDGITRKVSDWASVIGHDSLRVTVGQTLADKRKAQRDAEDIEVVTGNIENIRATLPFLLPQQQEDVLRAETQFFDESHSDREHAYGKGYMFTNGTGTGKTYTGLGIVKRFVKQGKGRVLILTPSQPKVADWMKDGRNLGLDIRSLDDWAKERETTATTERGEGVVITTFANFRQNEALLEDEFDLVVYDESHRLMENKDGQTSAGTRQHYLVSNRNENYAFTRLQKINPQYRSMMAVHDRYLKRLADISNNDVEADAPLLGELWSDAKKRAYPELWKIRQEYDKCAKAYNEIEPALNEQAKESARHTKVVFLSATPFNTRANLDYAEGYIFSYPEDKDTHGSYMSPRTRFYLDHFGAAYRYRYHRLEARNDNADAVARQEVEFSDWLQTGLQTMSGRIIDSEYDYSRDFPLVTGDYAARFNEVCQQMSGSESMRQAFWDVFGNYNYSSALFEAMKTSQAAPRIRRHLDLGRKVVVFHRRQESRTPLRPPFSEVFAVARKLAKEANVNDRERLLGEIESMSRKCRDMLDWEKTLDLRMPRQQLEEVFGKDRICYFSGSESTKDKKKSVDDFNNDNSGKDIIVVQEASGKEGISLHDTTGNHQRVCITLALPQSPITALQIEGRTYRIGNRSNAIFEYPLLGLDMEMILFGQTFNARVGTTENLALGSKARDLRGSFARGVEERSGDIAPESQGIGGKEFDGGMDSSEYDGFDRAMLDYYGNQKLSGRRDNREGVDYFPTPEPLGYMMAQWAHISEGDRVMEPSAGHGAIARYVPASNMLTAVEPSNSLFAKLQMRCGGTARKYVNSIFENYDRVNKQEVVLMNPPFGSAGRMAVDHVAKAFSHLTEGGRVVAIIPMGMATQKFEKWYNEQKDACLVGEVLLPDITFQQAGTSVRCRVAVIDKITKPELAQGAMGNFTRVDLSGRKYDRIEDFFEDVRYIDMPDRTIDYRMKLERKAQASIREFKSIKGVDASINDMGVMRVSGPGIWESIDLNSLTPENVREKMVDFFKICLIREIRYEGSENIRHQQIRETLEEMKRLAAKLADMSAEEMQRYAEMEDDGGVRYRLDEDGVEVEGIENLDGKRREEMLDYVSNYNSTPICVVSEEGDIAGLGLPTDVEEELRESLSDEETAAVYCKYDKKIYIFANKGEGLPMGEILLHENVHALVDRLGDDCTDFLKGFVAGVSRLPHKSGVYGKALRMIESCYPTEKVGEEFLAYAIQWTMREPRSRSWISESLDDETKDYLNEKIINYLYGKERGKERETDEARGAAEHIRADENEQAVRRVGGTGGGIETYEESERLSRYGQGAYSDAEVSMENDPWSKAWGESIRTKRQQKQFAERERKRMRDRVDALSSVLGIDIEVIEDASSLKDKKQKAKGWYDTETGEITVVVGNHNSAADMEATILHEGVAHHGLRQLLGEHFDEFLDKVYEAAENGIKEQIALLASRNGWNRRVATEEYLAGLAEETDFEGAEGRHWGWFGKIKRLFIDMLLKAGFKHIKPGSIGDNELRYILWRSYQNLAHPGRYRAFEWEAEDVAMQYKLQVGEYGHREEATEEKVAEAGELYELNERFNRELEMQIDGTLPSGHVYNMGMPSKELLSTGIARLPIRLSASVLNVKSNLERHAYDLSSVRNLVNAIQKPWAIFSYGDKGKAQNLIIGIEDGGRQFLVGISINPTVKGETLEINSIRNVFPKNNHEWINWINEGKLLRVDGKKDIQAIIAKLRMNPVAFDYVDLDNATKIVENFENPTIGEQNNNNGGEDTVLFRDGDFTPRDRKLAADVYEKMLSRGSWQFREATQDSMLGLKTLYESILGSNTRIENVAGHENAYLYENRMSSANNGEQHQYFSRFMKPLLESIHKLCGSKELDRRILTDYMMAKHGLERNEYMRKEAVANGEDTERDFAGLCGLTGEDDWQVAETVARQMVDDYEADHDTVELWDNVKKATNATLEKIYLSGLISEDTYNKVLGMYDFYIPLRGWDETTSDEVYGYLTSKDGPLMGNVFKKAGGRNSKADDPIATIAMMADDAIRQGNRNIMKQRFLNFVHGNPSDLVSVNEMWLQHNDVTDEWEPVFADLQPDMTHAEVESEIAKFESKMEALRTSEPDKYKKGRDARNIPYKVVRGNLNEHQVLVKRNGRTYVMTINGNPRAAQALNGLTNPDVEMGGVIGNMLKRVEYVNRHLSAFYTTRNPDFVVSNFMRDMLYSNCMTWVKENPRYALRFHKNFGRVNPMRLLSLLAKWEKGSLSDGNYLERMFKEFMLNGGETGYTSVKDIDGHKRTIASELKKQGSTGRKAWSALGVQLDLLNRSAENCARFAAFLTSREMGRSLDRSIYDAKEVSVNFNKKGSGGKFVNATGQKLLGKIGSYLGGGGRIAFVFWNAGIQGMTNFGRAGKRNPGKAIVGAAALFTFGYAIPLLAQMLGGGDDDDKNAYYNLPEYVRRSNICFKVGEQWITIPLPVEYRAIYGMGELACGVISGNERYSNSELARQMASQISQVMPLDMLEGGGGISPFIPSAFKPFTEAYIMNKGWTGLPVYKDTPYNKNDPDWTKAYQSADQHLVGFAKWLNETTGGNDYKKGAIDINPAKLEYLLNGTFGGMISFPMKVKKGWIETPFGDRDFEWSTQPFFNRVVKSGDERTANRKLQNEYYKYLTEYEETNRLRKKYENAADDGILGYAERVDFLYNSPEYLRFEIFEKYKPDIDAIREGIKEETNPEIKKELQGEFFSTMRELVDELHKVEKRK